MLKVSQITSVYNVDEWLERTIISFLNQTLKESELILINDCSPDKSMDIINKYIDNPRIKVINHEYNMGPGVARQTGINTSIGEYTIFVDGDDWLENDCLERMYNEAILNNADMVSCKTYQHNDYGLDKNHTKEEIWVKNDFYSFINNKLIKREIWNKTNYSHLRFREDINTLFRCLEFANKCISMNYVGYHYNLRPSSLTSTINNQCKNATYYALSVIENINFAKKHLEKVSGAYKFIFNPFIVCMSYKMALKSRKNNEYEEEIKEIESFLKENKFLK